MKSYLLLFATALIALLSTNLVVAQYSLSGIVTGDAGEGNLLEGVEVYIPAFHKLDLSKAGGTYIFNGIGTGVFQVQFSKQGYKTIVRTVFLKDTATVVHVKLESTSANDQQVLISSTINTDSPFSLESFSSESYIQSGDIDLAEALESQPGIENISEGNAFSKPAIRGLSDNHVQINQFGTRIENQSWYHHSILGINDIDVDKIDIIKGPASLLYGADASGGVMIVSEEKPSVAGTMEGDVRAAFHSNTVGYNLFAGLKGMSVSGIFYGFQMNTESYTSYIQGAGDDLRKNTEDLAFAVNSKIKNQKAKAYIGTSKSWGSSKLTYSYIQTKAGIIGIEDTIYDDPLRFNELQRNRELNYPYVEIYSDLISSENTLLLGHSQVNLNLAYQTNKNAEYQTKSEVEFKSHALDLNTITLDLKYSNDPLKKFGYTIGAQGIYQANKNAGLISFAPDAEMNSVGAFLLVRYDFKRWNFLAGARIDKRQLEATQFKGASDSLDFRPADFTRNYQPMSGSVGLVFHAGKDFSIKLNGSTGYTAPNFRQLYAYGISPDSTRFELGNDSLRLEQNAGIDLGLVWEGKSVTLSSDIFYNQLFDHIYLRNTGGFRVMPDTVVPVYYFAQSTATLSGAEFSIAVHPKNLRWFRFDIACSTQRASLDKGGDLAMMPADKAIFSMQFQTLKMNYLYSPYLRVVFSNYFGQDHIAGYEIASNAFSLVDLHAGGKIKWGQRFLNLSVSVNNLLNENYSNHLSALRSSSYREMGRNVVISLSMHFGIMKKK